MRRTGLEALRKRVHHSTPPTALDTPAPDDGRLEEGALPGGTLLAVHGANFHPARGGATCTFSPLAEAEDRRVLRTSATYVSPSRMSCRAPDIRQPTTLRLSIHFGERPNASDAVATPDSNLEPPEANTARLTYFDPAAPPRVLSTSPSYAEVHERVRVQVQGSNLSPAEGAAPDQLLCRFGETEVPASFDTRVKVACFSPLGAAPGMVEVGTSSDGGRSWTPSDAQFTFYDLSRPLELRGVTPDSSPLEGGAELSLEGANYSPSPEVRLGCALTAYGRTLGTSPASYISPTSLKCAAPAATYPADASLALVPLAYPPPHSGHLARWTSVGLPFSVFNASLRPMLSDLEPQGLPLAGGGGVRATTTIISVSGSGFGPDGVACSLGGIELAATFERGDLVRCEAPRAPTWGSGTPTDHQPPQQQPVSLPLRVRRGVAWSPPLTFSYFATTTLPNTTSAHVLGRPTQPAVADIHGGTSVAVLGYGFRPSGAGLQCLVGGVAVPANFVSVSQVECLLPPRVESWGSHLTVHVCVTVGLAGEHGACGARVTYYDASQPPTLASVAPAYVHAATAHPALLTLHGSNLAPTAGLACHVGDTEWGARRASSSHTAATFVNRRTVKCFAPPRAGHALAHLALTSGGERGLFSDAALPLTYYVPPTLLKVRPVAVDMGTEAIVTIEARDVFTRHGASNLRCRFTPMLPPAPPAPANANHTAPIGQAAAAAAAFFEVDGVKNWDHVQCLLPSTDVPRTVIVQLSTSAGTEYTPLNASHAVTQYDASRPPAPHTALPRVSGFPGGKLVTITGDNFAPVGRDGAPLTCHFGGVAVLATFVSVWEARCLAPAAERPPEGGTPKAHEVQLGLSNQRGAPPPSALRVPFVYYDDTRPPSVFAISPEYADVALRTPLLVRGENYAPVPLTLACLYSEYGATKGGTEPKGLGVVPATFVDVRHVRCRSPLVEAGTEFEQVSVRVTTDGAAYSTSSAEFTYFTSPEISAVTPPAGDRTRSGAIRVHGRHFFELPPTDEQPTSLFCRFGAAADPTGDRTTAGTYLSSSEIACATPIMASVVSLPVVISANRGHTFSSAAGAPLFTFYEPDSPPVISSVAPAYGPLAGGTPNAMLLRGSNFAPTGAALACRFSDVVVAVAFFNTP